MRSASNSPANETSIGTVLLIGVTGGTGSNAVRGFLDQGVNPLRAITRRKDLDRPSQKQLNQWGVELVEADLDDAASLPPVFEGITGVYCHATAGDSATADPREVERAKHIAQAAKQAQIRHFVYNSAGGVDRQSGVRHIEQKFQVEQILKQAGLPTTMLRACLFMEEFWKQYTRPAILKGSFPFSIQPDKVLHLITTRDMGRVAAYVLQHPSEYIGREIELAGDALTPRQLAEEFARVQGRPVVHKEVPAWIFLLFLRFQLFKLIQWYRQQGYQADVQHLREQEFPGLLTTFREFLQETDWADETRTYADL